MLDFFSNNINTADMYGNKTGQIIEQSDTKFFLKSA